MSTLHKVKAYFGMAPMDDYDDEYYDDDDRPSARLSAPSREDRFEDDGYGRGYDDRYDDEDDAAAATAAATARSRPRRTRASSTGAAPRFGALRGSTRGALAMDPRRMASCSRRAARCRRSPRCGPRTTARPAPSASGSATAPR